MKYLVLLFTLLLVLTVSCRPGTPPPPPTRGPVATPSLPRPTAPAPTEEPQPAPTAVLTEATPAQTRQPTPSVPPPTEGTPTGGGGEIDVSKLIEADTDILNIYKTVPGPYADAMAAGARVVNLEPMRWLRKHGRQAGHGHRPRPYRKCLPGGGT